MPLVPSRALTPEEAADLGFESDFLGTLAKSVAARYREPGLMLRDVAAGGVGEELPAQVGAARKALARDMLGQSWLNQQVIGGLSSAATIPLSLAGYRFGGKAGAGLVGGALAGAEPYWTHRIAGAPYWKSVSDALIQGSAESLGDAFAFGPLASKRGAKALLEFGMRTVISEIPEELAQNLSGKLHAIDFDKSDWKGQASKALASWAKEVPETVRSTAVQSLVTGMAGGAGTEVVRKGGEIAGEAVLGAIAPAEGRRGQRGAVGPQDERDWNKWNVGLWIANDPGLYEMAREIRKQHQNSQDAAAAMLRELKDAGALKTPDGAPYSVTNIRVAMEGMSGPTPSALGENELREVRPGRLTEERGLRHFKLGRPQGEQADVYAVRAEAALPGELYGTEAAMRLGADMLKGPQPEPGSEPTRLPKLSHPENILENYGKQWWLGRMGGAFGQGPIRYYLHGPGNPDNGGYAFVAKDDDQARDVARIAMRKYHERHPRGDLDLQKNWGMFDTLMREARKEAGASVTATPPKPKPPERSFKTPQHMRQAPTSWGVHGVLWRGLVRPGEPLSELKDRLERLGARARREAVERFEAGENPSEILPNLGPKVRAWFKHEFLPAYGAAPPGAKTFVPKPKKWTKSDVPTDFGTQWSAGPITPQFSAAVKPSEFEGISAPLEPESSPESPMLEGIPPPEAAVQEPAVRHYGPEVVQQDVKMLRNMLRYYRAVEAKDFRELKGEITPQDYKRRVIYGGNENAPGAVRNELGHWVFVKEKSGDSWRSYMTTYRAQQILGTIRLPMRVQFNRGSANYVISRKLPSDWVQIGKFHGQLDVNAAMRELALDVLADMRDGHGQQWMVTPDGRPIAVDIDHMFNYDTQWMHGIDSLFLANKLSSQVGSGEVDASAFIDIVDKRKLLLVRVGEMLPSERKWLDKRIDKIESVVNRLDLRTNPKVPYSRLYRTLSNEGL